MREAEIIVKLMFWPWFLLCYGVGTAAKLSGLERYRSEEGRKYDEQNMKRAEEFLKDTFNR